MEEKKYSFLQQAWKWKLPHYCQAELLLPERTQEGMEDNLKPET
jgi:hypothetical protein